MRRNKAARQAPGLKTYSYYKGVRTPRSASHQPPVSWLSLTKPFRYILMRFSVFRILILIVAVAILGFVSSAETEPIIRFSTKGVTARETSLYRNEAKRFISSTIFNRSKLLFDYSSVEKNMIERFPEIEQLNVTFDLVGRKPVISIMIREPKYIYQTDGVSWVVDSRGISLGLLTDLKQSYVSELPIIIDEAGTDGETGKTLMSTSQISYLSRLLSLLADQNISVSGIFIPSVPKQIDIILVGEGWRYKLNPDENAAQQAGTIIATRSTLESSNSTPSEYVDIRSSEKVFWK